MNVEFKKLINVDSCKNHTNVVKSNNLTKENHFYIIRVDKGFM